jgi:hypothetical protein
LIRLFDGFNDPHNGDCDGTVGLRISQDIAGSVIIAERDQ